MNAQTLVKIALEFGAPVLWDAYGCSTKRGFVYAVTDTPKNGGFVIGGNGLEETKARVSVVWDNGTQSQDLPDSIVAPWLDHAARAGMAPAAPETVTALLHAVCIQQQKDAAAKVESDTLKTDARARFLAKVAPLVPECAKGYIIAEYRTDESDSQTDYFGSSTSRAVLLGFSTHSRDLFPEMRKAARNHPETASLFDAPASAEHRQKYSMGGGYFLKDGSRHATGWHVSKRVFYQTGDARAAEIQTTEISISAPRPVKKPETFAAPYGPQGVTVGEFTHTKKGFQFFIVQLADRTTRDVYESLLAKAKAAGGWYSRKWGTTPAGFAFKEEKAARDFAAGLEGTPDALEPETAESLDVAKAAKLGALADKMQADIDSKFASRRENTPKQRQQSATARQDGRDLERAQKGLRAIAGLIASGAPVPSSLARVASKKAAVDLAGEKLDRSSAGYYDTGRPMGTPSNDTPAARAFWELAGGKTKEETRRDETATLEGKIRNQTIAGFFPTPAPVVARMIELAGIAPGHSVLEPSAGSGAIAQGLKDSAPGAVVTCLEVNATLCELLKLKGFHPKHADFMEPLLFGEYDRVLMNPPFEKGQDIAHVQKAFKHLKPGGVLVAITSPGWTFNNAAKFADFRAWFDRVGGTSENLAPGTFKESGTGVATVLIRIEKEG